MAPRGKGSNHIWTPEEDEKLVESMVEVKLSGKFDGENGNGLRKGYQKELERILQDKLPGHDLKEKPHIESRCKSLKKQYHAFYDVRKDGELSGFGWDDEKKCLTASADVWKDYLQKHPEFTFLKSKPFPYYDQLAIVWGQDRATGNVSEAPKDMLEDLEREENVNQDDEESDDEPQVVKSRGDVHSKQPEKKRRRSADGVVLCLERLGDAFTANMNKFEEQMDKFIDNMTSFDQQKKDNRQKLNEELQKIEVLNHAERQKVAMKLVRDSEMLDYFFTLTEMADKEIFLIQVLREN